MADIVGNVEVPVTTSAPVGDPLLAVLGSFFKAVLNAKASAAWGNVDPGHECVREVFTHDPNEASFNDNKLPALYIHRQSIGMAKWIGQDIRIRPSQIAMSWVPPDAPDPKFILRDAFLNAVSSVIEHTLEFEGRDASWVVPGDTDPLAATSGSLLWTFAKVHTLVARQVRHVPLIIREQADEGARSNSGKVIGVYRRVEVLFDVEERIEQDITLHYEPIGYLETTITQPNAPAPPLETDKFRIVG